MNQGRFDNNLFSPDSIANRSTSIIQYPMVSSETVIQSRRIILKFAHQGQIYVPERILLTPADHTIIVCADDALVSRVPRAYIARKRIIRCLRDMIQRHEENGPHSGPHSESLDSPLRVLLPTSFRAQSRKMKDAFEYIDLNLQEAMRFV